MDLCEYEVSMVYIENSRTAGALEKDSVSKNSKTKTKQIIKACTYAFYFLFFEARFYCVAQAGLKLVILLP